MKHESHDWESLDWDDEEDEYMCEKCFICTCCVVESELECLGEPWNGVIH